MRVGIDVVARLAVEDVEQVRVDLESRVRAQAEGLNVFQVELRVRVRSFRPGRPTEHRE